VPHIADDVQWVEEVANETLIQPNAYAPDMGSSKARRIKSLRTRFSLPNTISGTHTMCQL